MADENMTNSNVLFDTNGVTSSKRYLHTPSEFARKNLSYVQEVGELKSLKPHASCRKDLESYLFFVVKSGKGRVTVGTESYELKAGDCAFVDCRSMYEHISDEKEQWELMWVHCDGGIIPEYYRLFMDKNSSKPVYTLSSLVKYTEFISKLMSIQNDKDITSEFLSNEILTELTTSLIVEVINAGSKNFDPNILGNIRKDVNERYREEDLLESLCSEYGMDEMSINSLFKDKYGIDLCDYILNRRFTCAKELLRFSVKPVKDVIKESGIMNADLFRHLFLENEGMTAEEYRMKWAQWNRG